MHKRFLKESLICLKRLVLFLMITFLLSLIALTLKIVPIQLNLTASMPIGFYRTISLFALHRSDIVAVCLPHPIVEEGLQRGYLSKGKCMNGAMLVVKEVIAIPGDTVELTRDGFIVNGRFYPALRHELDSKARRIKYFVDVGIYININDYWLYVSDAPYDSWYPRYFRKVARHNVLFMLCSLCKHLKVFTIIDMSKFYCIANQID